MEHIVLVTDSGELVRIECKEAHYDRVMDAIDDAMKRGDWWYASMLEGISATYLGLLIDRVNMNKIIAML